MVAFEAGKEIMDLLRNKHPHAITALELMMTEIGACRFPSSWHASPELWHSRLPTREQYRVQHQLRQFVCMKYAFRPLRSECWVFSRDSLCAKG